MVITMPYSNSNGNPPMKAGPRFTATRQQHPAQPQQNGCLPHVAGENALSRHLVVHPVPVPTTAVQVDLSAAFNVDGITTDNRTTSPGNLDGHGNSYSANLLGSSVSLNGLTYNLGTPDTNNVVQSTSSTRRPSRCSPCSTAASVSLARTLMGDRTLRSLSTTRTSPLRLLVR